MSLRSVYATSPPRRRSIWVAGLPRSSGDKNQAGGAESMGPPTSPRPVMLAGAHRRTRRARFAEQGRGALTTDCSPGDHATLKELLPGRPGAWSGPNRIGPFDPVL